VNEGKAPWRRGSAGEGRQFKYVIHNIYIQKYEYNSRRTFWRALKELLGLCVQFTFQNMIIEPECRVLRVRWRGAESGNTKPRVQVPRERRWQEYTEHSDTRDETYKGREGTCLVMMLDRTYRKWGSQRTLESDPGGRGLDSATTVFSLVPRLMIAYVDEYDKYLARGISPRT